MTASAEIKLTEEDRNQWRDIALLLVKNQGIWQLGRVVHYLDEDDIQNEPSQIWRDVYKELKDENTSKKQG